ncbi:hypothetical protein J7U46_09720 [Pelomonas sp. V22]|uniref:hypothetical protein n=1 Tax=Pelomonas sp. V22 TaxID=2822139 RepID=UPI0024A85FAD|nr:hypothetical protein [Pelomonas sp. V22]MDI4633324.1 hypothetical protein [Pelomonas sp. V22]
MNSTIVIWLLLSLPAAPEKVKLNGQFESREACNDEQLNKHFEQPKVEHRCVPLRVFVPVKKGPQQ